MASFQSPDGCQQSFDGPPDFGARQKVAERDPTDIPACRSRC
jgi:hypothetical protein